MPLFLAVLLLSAAALAYEILLMRHFSIALWHHFAYMVISLALLGYGASGTFLGLARRWLVRRFGVTFVVNSSLFGLASVGALAVAQRLPFNPLEIVWDPRQSLLLGAVYLLLAVPFFFAANAIGLCLTALRERIHRIYLADLLGAGLGAALVVLLLYPLSVATCLRAVVGVGLLAAAVAAMDRALDLRTWIAPLLVVAAVAAPLAVPDSWIEPRVSQFKGLAQALRMPGAEVISERSSPLARLDVVRSPRIPFRHAPGLSLAFTGEIPRQLGIFVDADALTVVDEWSDVDAEGSYLDWVPSALPYALLERPRVLVLGAGGGSQVVSALVHEATEIDAVEVNSQLASLVRTDFGDFAGNLYQRPEIALHVLEARGYVERSERRWDLIQLALVDSFDAAAAGVHALSETYLYTEEALASLAGHLQPGGYLAITRWLSVPPRDSVKVFATAVAALERLGVDRPGERIAMIRTWNTATLIVASRDLTDRDIAAVREFAEERSFDLAYYPGMERSEANRFNRLDRPYLFDAATAILGPERERFFEDYKFHVAPATDTRPYFFRFFKWETLPELLRLRGGGGTPLIQWSYLIVVGTLAQALVGGLLFIVLPLFIARRRVLAVPGTARVGGYFLALGLGFLFVEITLIHRFTLFLAHPLYAVAVVLGSFLVFAGLGSGFSRRLTARLRRLGRIDDSRALAAPSVVAAGLCALYLALFPFLLPRLIALPEAARLAAAILLLAPLAFFMGMPFPLGLRRVSGRNTDWVPWAWAVNGSASVVAAVGATLLAIHLGFPAVLAAGGLLYLLAAVLALRL